MNEPKSNAPALDAGTTSFLEAVRAAGGKPTSAGTPEEFRAAVRTGSLALGPPREELHDVRDLTIPGPGGPLPLRIYIPRAPADGPPLPVVVFLHGAGWVGGDLDTHDAIARVCAKQADALVIAVDYRLAPEHPFPAAVEDAWAAVEWAVGSAGDLHADGARLALVGDSAGGTLAAVVCQQARDRGGPPIALQVLLYPSVALGLDGDFPSRAQFGSGEYFISTADIAWFRSHYLGGSANGADPRVSPLARQDLGGLPPALIITAGFDPLRDEGRAYADRLREAGVPVEYRCFESTVHAFVSFAALIPAAGDALGLMAARLRAALHTA